MIPLGPLPEVPAEREARREALPSAVRCAILLLVASALANVARETVYLVGAIQYSGAPGLEDIRMVVNSVLLLLPLAIVVLGLTKLHKWAWWAGVAGSLLFLPQIMRELSYLMQARAGGDSRGDFQIFLLTCMIGLLSGAALYLLSRNARTEFS